MSHVTRIKESWHTFEWVTSHLGVIYFLWGSHGTHIKWVTTHTWMSHGTHINKSWHTYEWVMSHIWMGHGTHMNESWHTYEWVMAHICMSHGTHMNKSWHTKCVPWRIHMCAMTWVMANIVMSHIWGTHMRDCHMCAMTHSYVCHDSFICVPWPIHMCDMTHHTYEGLPYVWWMSHGEHIHVMTMNEHMIDFNQVCVSCDLSVRVIHMNMFAMTPSSHIWFLWMNIWLIWMIHINSSCEHVRHDSFITHKILMNAHMTCIIHVCVSCVCPMI